MTLTDKLVLLERISALSSGIVEQLEKWTHVESKEELLALQELTRRFSDANRALRPVTEALRPRQVVQS